jgi:hypothetical protein
MTCLSVNCYIWENGCNADWSVMAAWTQAILSGAAIWWASKTAFLQVAWQFRHDRLSRRIEHLEEQTVFINALLHQTNNIKEAAKMFFEVAKQTQATRKPIAKFEVDRFMHTFQDALDDIQKISIYGLENANLIGIYIALRHDVRQIQFNCNLILNSTKVYTPSDFNEFESAWMKGLSSFETLMNEIEFELQSLIGSRNDLMKKRE